MLIHQKYAWFSPVILGLPKANQIVIHKSLKGLTCIMDEAFGGYPEPDSESEETIDAMMTATRMKMMTVTRMVTGTQVFKLISCLKASC